MWTLRAVGMNVISTGSSSSKSNKRPALRVEVRSDGKRLESPTDPRYKMASPQRLQGMAMPGCPVVPTPLAVGVVVREGGSGYSGPHIESGAFLQSFLPF